MSGIAIGIDVGTSSVCAALVDAAGAPVAWGPHHSPPGSTMRHLQRNSAAMVPWPTGC
jgi:ribulose kinase